MLDSINDVISSLDGTAHSQTQLPDGIELLPRKASGVKFAIQREGKLLYLPQFQVYDLQIKDTDVFLHILLQI